MMASLTRHKDTIVYKGEVFNLDDLDLLRGVPWRPVPCPICGEEHREDGLHNPVEMAMHIMDHGSAAVERAIAERLMREL